VGGKDATLSTPAKTSVNVGGLVVSVDQPNGSSGFSNAVSLLLLITILSIAPAFLMMMTSFTRIIIVLGFLRRALGTQTLPPNQVMVGLALFLTLFVMAPTIERLNNEAVQPFMGEQITQEQAMVNAKGVIRDFMIKHTRKNDLALFIRLANEPRPMTVADVSFTTLIPAFITSELKTAFQMGFIIFLPFLIIDLVISAVLMALGMMMLPPVVVSLPFKILLFVLVDGWVLLLQGLVRSYA
jgi:flagellar biosynthetic protein FliP